MGCIACLIRLVVADFRWPLIEVLFEAVKVSCIAADRVLRGIFDNAQVL